MCVGQHPLHYFIDFDEILATMRAVNACITEGEIISMLGRNLSSDFDVEKRSTLNPGITRELPEVIAYSAHDEREHINPGRQLGGGIFSHQQQHGLQQSCRGVRIQQAHGRRGSVPLFHQQRRLPIGEKFGGGVSFHQQQYSFESVGSSFPPQEHGAWNER